MIRELFCRPSVVAAAVGALAGTAVGTSGCSGGGARVQTNTKSAGEQIQDLDKARADGLVSDREYERMRKRIVRDND